VTLPGLGAAPAGHVSLRKAVLADWVRDQLSGAGIRRFALVGHDWGATVAALLAVKAPTAVTALVVEEEILPGIDVDIPAPGRDIYPSWHGPFNRAPGLAERLVPGREDAYYGTFLTQSSGPYGLDPEAVSSYLAAYGGPGILEAGLGYYRTRGEDIDDVRAAAAPRIQAPILAIGGRYAMGSAVAEGLRPLATEVTSLVLERSGHYPVEQEPEQAIPAIIEFLRRRGNARQ